MSSVPFHYIDLRAFCYATEEEERVRAALGRLLPPEFDVTRVESEGHYGDRIVVLSARVESADDVRTVLAHVGDLEESDRQRLDGELEKRVDENCSFFVTFDKQAACSGRVRLGDGITLRGKVEAYPAKKDRALAAVEDTFEGL